MTKLYKNPTRKTLKQVQRACKSGQQNKILKLTVDLFGFVVKGTKRSQLKLTKELKITN